MAKRGAAMNIPQIDMQLTGRNISSLRRNSGLSVRQLQDMIGFSSPQAIYKWESGVNVPSIDNLVILASIFHVDIDDIIICRNEERIQDHVPLREISSETLMENIENDDFLVKFGDPVMIQIPEYDGLRHIVCMSISLYEELLNNIPDCELRTIRLSELLEIKELFDD